MTGFPAELEPTCFYYKANERLHGLKARLHQLKLAGAINADAPASYANDMRVFRAAFNVTLDTSVSESAAAGQTEKKMQRRG